MIKKLNNLAGSHVKGCSTTPQPEGREEREGKGKSSVAEMEAGTSAAEGDPVTNRQPRVSLPKTVHKSLAQQETQAVTRSAATGQAVVGEGEESEEQHNQGDKHHDSQGTTGIVAKRAASITTLQSHSTAGAGIHMVQHPMRKDVCQKSGSGACRTGSSTEDGSTTHKIVLNASNDPLSKEKQQLQDAVNASPQATYQEDSIEMETKATGIEQLNKAAQLGKSANTKSKGMAWFSMLNIAPRQQDMERSYPDPPSPYTPA